MTNHESSSLTSSTNGTADELSVRAKELARDAGAAAATRMNDAGAKGMTAMGRAVHDAARRVDETGRHMAEADKSPVKAEHVDALTAPLEKTAKYLTDSDPKQVASDIDNAVHRHPYRAAAIGLAAGWLIGRFVSGRK